MNGMRTEPPVLKLQAHELGERLGPELAAYHAIYSPLFKRQEQREQSQKYLEGLVSNIPNKSIEAMVLHREGDKPNAVRAAQQFVSKGAWSDAEILAQHWREVEQDLGERDGVLILDGSDFPKQGSDSVGVKRQWCGQLGKTANSQAGVFLGYASRRGYTLIHRRLYMPREWLQASSHVQRRTKCGVPADLSFQTKPELGLAMLREVAGAGSLSYQWLTCDEDCGKSPDFLDQAGELVTYFAKVPHPTRVWCTRPATAVPTGSGQGRPPIKERVVPDASDPQEVATIAAQLPSSAWATHTVKEGTKGPIQADFACLRVVAVRNQLPGPDLWLVFRRSLNGRELKAFLSNAAPDTSLEIFVWLSGMRWPVESCFEEAKQEVGLGDYQTRSWTGWHHHMTLCLLAHFLLVRLQLRLQDEAPDLTLPQAILLLQSILPKPDFDAELALDIVQYRQRRNHAAYRSHRKKRINQSKVSL
ncbi:MAG: IS701 family transposase [Caldilineaceae bacterium]|nr:IS701 family transposase [Caldilineaceae bacterium]